MSARNWDKARRYQKVGRFDPIESFKPRRSKYFKRLRAAKPGKPADQPRHDQSPVIRKVLQVVSADKMIYSIWTRRHGVWRCISAQEPLEWFTRLRHPELAKNFLLSHHFQFNWLNAIPDAQNSPQHKASEETPADSYTANAPSHAPAVNTSPSLNNDTQAERAPCVK